MEAPEQVAVEGLIDALVATDRAIAELTAVRAATLDLLRRTARDEMALRSLRAEIGCATRAPERSVDRELDEAFALAERLPATREALAEGRITVRHARVLVREAIGLADALRPEWERRALRETHRSTGDFARTVRRLRDRLAPESAIERHRAARERADVVLESDRDGMACLVATLPAPEAVAVHARVDDAARDRVRAEPGLPIGVARAEVFADLLLDRRPAGSRLGQVRATVVVTVPALTLLGRGDEPAELVGHGPIDPATAAELAADAPELRRLLTDPHSGAPLALGRERYRPSSDLRLWLRLRDARCRFAGCGRRAEASDVDHVRDWARGGTTDAANLLTLCRGHHRLKHTSSWSASPPSRGGRVVEWVSPLGRRYRSVSSGSDPDPP
ncbi:MAG: DUF222 domain-containing protein [Actinomycetales bacterium]|nr:DUF222 domain-containing protein [Actinomycetales bacterium]